MRIVHLGLGNFFRAHQAWYTSAAPDAAQWPIAAFTGRSPGAAVALNAQHGRYTLLVRGPEHDEAQMIGAVDAAYPSNDHQAWREHLAAPRTAVVTLTVTEAGYLRDADGGLDESRAAADVAAWLRGDAVQTVPGRLMAGLAERRISGGGPIAIVPCDNLPENGAAVARVLFDFTALAEPALVPWIRDSVSFVTTMVDRITPRTTAEDVRVARELTGFDDAVPVVTEPFSEWVLSGVFPAGRPSWEAAGARFVADIVPHEQRKLLLLNGGHSLLAYAGSTRGHATVADAVTDPECRTWLAQWWDEASGYVPLPPGELAEYREALLTRFGNGRIRHTLAQIAADGSQKLPVRVLPVLRGEVAAGRLPAGAIRIVAGWIDHLRGAGAPVSDAGAAPFQARAASVRDVLALLAPDLAGNDALVAAVDHATLKPTT
ncbi:mannitol dehydrogenase family protein [Paractinoplanes globisporus]|uniref:Mannitol-1-phosphate 5-dehydrogenase n=1 Tax=Paractinoplanes globisporus TaxID=113565 RepID=A0ABW6W477_9ACTN|nr:mannitol dehydrogenase family protein [Actinoplanes globisporus]